LNKPIENDDYASQLRSLRLILAEKYRPISTETLAAMTHIAPVSIRGVEAGRRQLNSEDRTNIEIYLGAVWDTESRRWVCSWDHRVEFDRLEYEVYSNQMDPGKTLARANYAVFARSLDYLFHGLKGKEATVALLKLHHQLLAIARENNLSPEVIESNRPIQNPHSEQFPVRQKKKDT
jgi:hypothetical protein